MNKIYFTISLPLILLASFCLPAPGATNYYVETAGSETNDGSIFYPFQTIGQAISAASSGDTINVGIGEFREFLNISKPVTLNGQNAYFAQNPPLSRHQSATIIRAPADTPGPLITVSSNNVTIQNISIYGDASSNGVPSVGYGIYTASRPINVINCKVSNIFGSGIACRGTNAPAPLPGDTDPIRSYLTYNLISNISHSSNAVGIYLEGTQATVEYNEISGVNGSNALAGIYIYKCYYTTNMSSPLMIRSNYLNNCAQAIWANNPVFDGEAIEISGNTITNSLIGIRATAAKGQATVSGNLVHVKGVSTTTNQTPARGIWLQADLDPWNTLYETDHQVFQNTLISEAVTNDGTIGMLFEYDTTTRTNMNNGVRATVLTNYIYNFAIGSMIVSGTNGVSNPTNKLVEVIYHFNDIYGSVSAALMTTGFTYMVDATNNFLGYSDPSNFVSTNINYTGWTLGSLTLDTDGDGTLDYEDDDDDNDALTDTNELPIGTSPTREDSDFDGMSDPDEYFIAGTHPLNPASVLSLKNFSWTSGIGASFEWPSVTGRTYYVHRTTNLIDGLGAPITNFTAAVPTNSYTDPDATGTLYFYQISVTTN